MNRFLRYLAKIEPKKPVQSIQVQLLARDFTGTIHATDIQLQGGGMLTGWAPNTEEMLARARDSNGNIVPPKHFNALIRGSNMVIIPNTGGITATVDQNGNLIIYTPPNTPATTGLDVNMQTIKPTTGPVQLQTYYQTRTFTYSAQLNQGDTVEIDSASHKVLLNGSQIQPGPSTYQGAPLTCPYGDVIYRINLNGRDAVRFVFIVEEWTVAQGVTW